MDRQPRGVLDDLLRHAAERRRARRRAIETAYARADEALNAVDDMVDRIETVVDGFAYDDAMKAAAREEDGPHGD